MNSYIKNLLSKFTVYHVFLAVFLMFILSFAYVKMVNDPLEPEVLQQLKNDNLKEVILLEKNRIQVLFIQEIGWFFLVFACLVLSIILWIGLSNRKHKSKTYIGYKYSLTEKLTRNVKQNLSFQKRLHIKYQVLTSNDLLVAEMLVDGLSSKEISSELNISQASVNTARYRLRKKMQLSPETDLLDFLKDI